VKTRSTPGRTPGLVIPGLGGCRCCDGRRRFRFRCRREIVIVGVRHTGGAYDMPGTGGQVRKAYVCTMAAAMLDGNG
jgi:hypothetical protein